MKNKLLTIRNLYKTYTKNNDAIKVLDNISFDINEGEIISIVGTSGCGKSTLLNILSGVENKTSGNINYLFDNENQIGYMMQDSALFPWLNIEKNASLSSKIKNVHNKNNILNLLKDYGLYEFKDRFPNELSGGMKQRVSLIRTISLKPKLLLLDEPFSQLDYQSRLSISLDVYKLVRKNNISVILITHDIEEAISLSDKVIVLSNRPAKIKKIYTLNFDRNIDPIKRKESENFIKYFNQIGKDLDILEK
jgi:NitT/TauT family transport system ATP-binding protein